MNMTDNVITIVLPRPEDRPICDMLRTITKALVKKTGTCVSGVFGGEFGYGGEWKSDVFQMHPYCWCEEQTCPWCAGCSCGAQVFFCLHIKDRKEPDIKCDWCNNVHKFVEEGTLPPAEPPHGGAPNFWHKQSGLKIWWYKYIGRNMTCKDAPVDLSNILAECLADISK